MKDRDGERREETRGGFALQSERWIHSWKWIRRRCRKVFPELRCAQAVPVFFLFRFIFPFSSLVWQRQEKNPNQEGEAGKIRESKEDWHRSWLLFSSFPPRWGLFISLLSTWWKEEKMPAPKQRSVPTLVHLLRLPLLWCKDRKRSRGARRRLKNQFVGRTHSLATSFGKL